MQAQTVQAGNLYAGVEMIFTMCMVMASGVNLGASNDATAIKMTVQQLQPRTSSVPVTSGTGNRNGTVTLLPSQFSVPLASASPGGRVLTTQQVSSMSANIQQVRISQLVYYSCYIDRQWRHNNIPIK